MLRKRSALVVLSGAVVVSMGAACGTRSVPPSSLTPPAAAGSTASPRVSAAVASPSAKAPDGTVFDTATIKTEFSVPLTIDVPTGWRPLYGHKYGNPTGALSVVHHGADPEDSSQWWGLDIWIVDGAKVADPTTLARPADRSDYTLAWPADFVSYVKSWPGAKIVSGPEPVEIGGAKGVKVIVTTAPMHPFLWLKNDTTWMGGGATGFEPALERLMIVLDVGGKPVLLQLLDEDPARFDKDLPMVEELLQSIKFGA